MCAAPETTAVKGQGPSPALATALVVLLCIIWGSTWLVIKEGLKVIPPWSGASLRFLLAGVIMAMLAPKLSAGEGGKSPDLTLTLAVGVGQFAGSYAIVYWSETILPSGLVSVLWAIFPLVTAICGHFFLKGERLRAGQWWGFVCAFLGVGLLFATDLAKIGPQAIPAGLVLLLSPLITAACTVVVKRRAQDTSSVLMNRNGMLLGGALLGLLALIFERDAEIQWTASAVGSIFYLAIAGTVVTFGLYFWLLRYVAAYRMSLIAYVTPLIALGVGATLGDEAVGLHTLAGTALILAGTALAFFLGRRRA